MEIRQNTLKSALEIIKSKYTEEIKNKVFYLIKK